MSVYVVYEIRSDSYWARPERMAKVIRWLMIMEYLMASLVQ